MLCSVSVMFSSSADKSSYQTLSCGNERKVFANASSSARFASGTSQLLYGVYFRTSALNHSNNDVCSMETTRQRWCSHRSLPRQFSALRQLDGQLECGLRSMRKPRNTPMRTARQSSISFSEISFDSNFALAYRKSLAICKCLRNSGSLAKC